METSVRQEKGLTHADRAGFLIAGRAAGRAIALAAPIVLTRLLTREDFGTYRQLVLLSGLLSRLVLLGFPQTVLYFYPRVDRSQRATVISQVSIILLALGLVAAGLLFALRSPIAILFNNPPLADFVPLFAVYAAITTASGHVVNLLIVQRAARRAAAFAAAVMSAPATGAVVGALVLGGVGGAVAGLVGAGCAVGIWGGVIVFRLLLRERPGRGTAFVQTHLLREQLSYGVPLGLAGAVGAVEHHLDHVLVSGMLSPESYAVYSIGAVASPFVVLLGSGVVASLVPVWAGMLKGAETTEAMSLFRGSTRKLALGVLPLTVYLLLVAPDLLPVLFSDKYAASAPVFRILVLMLAVHAFIPDGILRGAGRTRALLAGHFGTLVLGTGLVAFGIHVGGLPGAAAGMVVAEVLRKVYYGLVVRGVVGRGAGPLLPWGHLGRIGAIALAAAIPTAVALWALDAALARLVVGGLVYGATYVLLLTLTGTLTSGDRALIRRWLSPAFLVGRRSE
jgi:O-antigen/teichoic acid export membrane protein